MGETCEVAVTGTGVVGLAVAWELLDRGLTVSVIGPGGGDHRGQASRAAGAMLSTFSEIEPGHTPERVATETAERLAAHQMYPAWLERLGVGQAQAQAGTWVLAPAGRRAWLDPIAGAARIAGHPAELHDAAEIPGLTAPPESAAALWLPTEARVDSHVLLDSLAAAIGRHPRARWLDTTAVSSGPGTIRCADGSMVTAGHAVLAAGAAIPSLLPEAGRPIGVPPILAGRGVSLLLRAPALPLTHVVRTPNAAFACGVHLVPRADTMYLGGTNRLTTSPDPERRPSAGELSALIGDATALLDHRLSAAEVLAARMGLRPYTLDHLPLIGRTGESAVLLATATYRCGILLAPRLAELTADEITSPGALDEHPYRVLRPLAVPGAETIANGVAGDILDHVLQGGGRLAPQAAAELAAFLPVALRAVLAGNGQAGDTALRRLWQAAPVPEVIPSLLTLAARLENGR